MKFLIHPRASIGFFIVLIIVQISGSIIDGEPIGKRNKIFGRGQDDYKLKLVFLFHRHGERTPYGLYPKDPNAQYIIDTVGIGQLIKTGKQRLYELGEYLSKRYLKSGLLKIKSPHEIYIRSSGSERCLESVELLLAGMFPPKGRWIWNDHLGKLWQPFPVQTVSFDEDSLLNPDFNCPVAFAETNSIYQTTKPKELCRKNMNLLKNLSNWTGYDARLMESNIIYASYVYDTLLSEKNFNLTLPKWADEKVLNQLSFLNDEMFFFNSSSRNVQRFRCGSIFRELFSKLDQHLKYSIDKHSLYIYSTHDTWLALLLSAMKVYNNVPPSFGATVMLEVYHSLNQTLATVKTKKPIIIKGYYLNETKSERPYQLSFPFCQHTDYCTFEEFYESLKDLILTPEQLQRMCFNE